MDQQIGRKLKHFTDYASKSNARTGPRRRIPASQCRMNPDGTSTAPSQLSNAERKHRITEAWQKHLAKFSSTAKRPVIAHRLVFSMSKEQHDVLTDAGSSFHAMPPVRSYRSRSTGSRSRGGPRARVNARRRSKRGKLQHAWAVSQRSPGASSSRSTSRTKLELRLKASWASTRARRSRQRC